MTDTFLDTTLRGRIEFCPESLNLPHSSGIRTKHMAKTKGNSNGGLVYSTEKGRLCPDCERQKADCICSKKKAVAVGGVVRVGRQTQGRKGKGVTVISGIPLPEAEIKELAKKLKKICGAGGSLKNGIIEIQGDHRELLIKELQQFGWPIKRSGG